MATSTKNEIELQINDVASEDVLSQMEYDGQIVPFGIYVTPEEESGSGGTGQIILRRWTD